MGVAVQHPLAECTAILTLCIVKHRSPPCAATNTQNMHRSKVRCISRQSYVTVQDSAYKYIICMRLYILSMLY